MSSPTGIIHRQGNSIQVALVSSHTVVHMDADVLARTHLLGSVYLGRVTRRDHTFYWVDLGSSVGVLALEKDHPPLNEGALIPVEITRESFWDLAEQAHKAVHLKKHPMASPVEQTKVGPIQSGPSILERFLQDLPENVSEILIDDLELVPLAKNYCHQHRPDLLGQIKMTRGNLFEEHDLADFFDTLLHPRVPFPGGSLFLEETSCTHTIDVNGLGNAQELNLAAIPTLAQQILFRGLCGHIIVDFINSAQGHRREIEDALKPLLSASPLNFRLGSWSKLGWLEISSEKRRLPLHQRLRFETKT